MILFERPQTFPYFNIAAEEWMLKYAPDDCIALWRNEPAVIIGKHQNALAEIDIDYISQNQIPVIRRMSGGGAVFHDLGNVCFSMVKNIATTPFDFKEFTLPVIETLKQLGITAHFEGRNDLTIQGLKFSGNAKCVHKDRILLHGTLLFSSQINDLSNALKADPQKFEDKAVKSVRSRVTNISEHLENPISVTDFISLLNQQFIKTYPDMISRPLLPAEIDAIETLSKEKYQTWEWNFGLSPDFQYENKIRTAQGGCISSHLNIEQGKISRIQFMGDFFCHLDIAVFEQKMIGLPYEQAHIANFISTEPIQEYFLNINECELLQVILG